MAPRRSNRPIVFSDDEEGEPGNSQAPNGDIPHSQGRAAKSKANQAWQELIPGQHSQQKSKDKATSGTSKKTHGQSQTEVPRKYLPPAIDNSSGSEMELGAAASRRPADSTSPISRRKTQGSSPSKPNNTSLTSSKPPRTGTKPSGSRTADRQSSSEDETADEDNDNHSNGGDERDDEDAEKTDDDGDNDLRKLESNPRALDDLFHAEEAYFVDSDRDQDAEMAILDNDEAQGRQIAPKSGKTPFKRAYRARVDSADERESGDDVEVEPPVKKVKPTPVRSSAGKKSQKGSAPQTSAVKAKGADTSKGHNRTQGTSKSASKRKREKQNEDIEWGKEWPAKRGRTSTSPDPNPSGLTTSIWDDDDDDGIELVLDQSKDRLELKQQRPRVQVVVSTAIENVGADLCLVNAYPEGPEKLSDYGRRWLIAGAKKCKDDDILRRLKSDNGYWRKMAALATQRISNTRGKVKRVAEQLPPIFYSLTSGDANYVTWLTEGNRFLYPNDYRNRTVVGTEPFNVPVFEHLLRTAFFYKTRSTGYRLLDCFESSLPDRPDEKEIPGPMLRLVATALYAAIEDYRSPRYNAADFNGNIYLDVYREVMTILNNVKRDRPRKYHNMMHTYYKNICTGSGPSSRGAALSVLNIADMPDE